MNWLRKKGSGCLKNLPDNTNPIQVPKTTLDTKKVVRILKIDLEIKK